MLSIGKLGSGQGAYYLDKVAGGAEDYYSGEGEAEGRWLGEAAAELGLEGTVNPDQLTAMLTGGNPATGEPFGLRAVPGRGPVPGFDLTLSAPKSVSLLWALGGAAIGAQVEAAHQASLDAALDYLQREACWTRRGAGGHEFVHGNGFLAAGYLHRSSRAGDPQLHTHVLVANLTKGPDGLWTRLYHPTIYNHAKAAGYIYEAQLRWELTQRLSVRWQEVRNGIAEIEGFADEHLRRFSTRRAQILEAVGSDASARARQIATLTTREAKEEGLAPTVMRERWQTSAEEVGLDRATLFRTTGREQFSGAPLTAERIDQAVTARASHFDRRNVIQAVAEGHQEGAPAAEVEQIADAFLASGSVIAIGHSGKGEQFTTARIWAIEQRALASVGEMAAMGDRGLAGELAAAREIAARPNLKPDQRAMVERLLTGGEGIVVVIGEAGTGKTYALGAAASGWAAQLHPLRVAAPTWRAANVLRSEGLEATSVARLLAEFEREAATGRPPLLPNSVLLIDEAGMVDSATLARLIDHAQEATAKLVLIGDPAQLGEIEAGGLFAGIAARIEPVVLDEVIRHRHAAEREAARRIRAGEGAEALSLLRTEERVIVAPDGEARREAMVGDWWQSFGAGEDALMVAKRNVEVAKLNALARELMRSEGRLGEREIEVGGECFAAGDQVITRINDHRAHIYNRERWRVVEVDPQAQRVVLDGIDTARRVCVDTVYLGRVTESGDPALQHAYAATTYQAQGSTVDRAYVMADPSMDRQEFYVATSRSSEETYLYATPEIQAEREEYAPRSPYLREDLEHVAEAVERDGAQVAAHDFALRAELAPLSNAELVERRGQLERRCADLDRPALEAQIERREVTLANVEHESAAPLGRPPGRAEELRAQHERVSAGLAEDRKLLAQIGPEDLHAASAELAGVEALLSGRRQVAFAAARVSPSSYALEALGGRPSDPAKREAWDRGLRAIEGYRLEHGVVDRDSALGAKWRDSAEWLARRQVERTIAEAQRSLGRGQEVGRSVDLGIGM
jgi:conjugative relaxase-like TrwC/TraI family protein